MKIVMIANIVLLFKCITCHVVITPYAQNHDKARRFITFVDEIYDAGKFLRWTSETPPHEIFRFLAPEDLGEEETGGGAGRRMLGTDHSWADKDIVHGESMAQKKEKAPFEYEKASFDSISVSSEHCRDCCHEMHA
jgi:predicted ATPase